MANQITEAQFSAAQDKLDAELRGARRGTHDRAVVDARLAKWEAANALPQATWQNRKDRLEAIAAVAAELGLI